MLAIALLGAAPQPASAEPYLAGYLGAAFTESTDLRTEIELSGAPVANGRARDVRFDTAPVFGAKLGYFFDADLLGGNTGIELDVYHFEPDVPRQTVKFSGQLAGFTGDTRTQIQPRDIALFAEYKFVQTQVFSFTFKESGTAFGGFPVTETARDRAVFSGHLLYGGLGIHW